MLEAAGIDDLFPLRVDGIVAAELGAGLTTSLISVETVGIGSQG